MTTAGRHGRGPRPSHVHTARRGKQQQYLSCNIGYVEFFLFLKLATILRKILFSGKMSAIRFLSKTKKL